MCRIDHQLRFEDFVFQYGTLCAKRPDKPGTRPKAARRDYLAVAKKNKRRAKMLHQAI